MKTQTLMADPAINTANARIADDAIHRRLFQRAAEHVSCFRDRIAERPPRPVIAAAELETLFAGPTPEIGADPLQVIDALRAAADPGLTGSAGPRFFGWVIGASHPVGVAADMLTSGWGQNAGSFSTAPAAAMAEKVASRWLLDLLQLPRECSVGFVTGATMANFVCLAAARNAVLARVGWNVELDGLASAPPVRLFVGADAHVTIFASLRYLGFGERVTQVPTDAEGRMDADALGAALARGVGPAIVIAQAGQIHTGAFDPFAEIARLSRQHGAWLHVDGAFGLWARTVPELTDLTEDLEHADSWSTDGHKWLQLPYDSGFAIVRDREAHRRAMSITASYLPIATDTEYDPGAYVPELSRRARGFAVWAQLRALGRQGITKLVSNHCALARRLAARLSAEPGIHVLNDVSLNQVIVNFGLDDCGNRDSLTRATVARLQADGICLVGGAEFHGRYVLRISVIAAPLTESDVDRLAVAIMNAWRHIEPRHARA
jgi:glutamate/tyrosine decarboxylase-like PLP-dependent enzyme